MISFNVNKKRLELLSRHKPVIKLNNRGLKKWSSMTPNALGCLDKKFVDFLRRKGLKHTYCRAFNNDNEYDNFSQIEESSRFLVHIFMWTQTKEGANFWQNVDIAWQCEYYEGLNK